MPGDTAPPATGSASVLELLPLPKVASLSDDQLRGATCVWCDTSLSAETARNLGERPHPDGGTLFPRGCSPCARKRAYTVYRAHHRTCQQCGDDPTECDTQRALHRLALEGRR